MNRVVDKMNEYLMHYGMPRRSGRYPWGSGKDPYQRTGDFISRIDSIIEEHPDMVFVDSEGKKYTGDTAIAKYMGISTREFRIKRSICQEERRSLVVDKVKSLKEDGLSNEAIAKELGLTGESTVRSLLNQKINERMQASRSTADFLKKEVDEKKLVDVGASVPEWIGISNEKMNVALYMLEEEGYHVYSGRVAQQTNPGKKTTMKVLCAPGVEHKDIFKTENIKQIKMIEDYVSNDGGETFKEAFRYPESLDSKRLMINYADTGNGKEKDGLIEIRRGVPDLSLGKSNYAQVRIMVDGTHYLKGMAVYADDLPEGIDVRFNTGKTSDVDLKKKNASGESVLKPCNIDKTTGEISRTNPFKSLIKEHGGQSDWVDENGESHLSLINKRADEGDWGEWSHNLPAQFLSKQSVPLAKQQLNKARDEREVEFNKLINLTNPTIKKEMLYKFAEECDTAAVHLKAAALPRQQYQVILPSTTLKADETYAPNFKNGEKLALIRYPHSGTFEIPIVTVNNTNKEGKRMIGNNPADALCINSEVAQRLSGADFDGDTVMVIPLSGSKKIVSTKQLEGLKNFDHLVEYGGKPLGTFKQMTKSNTQREMGIISNLITDMTLIGASEDDLAAAVRHSMVVIDAEKHHLDYKQSEKDNHIKELKQRYQVHTDDPTKYGGAATLISKSRSEQRVPKRRGDPIINDDGNLSYKLEGPVEKRTKDGDVYYVTRTQASTKMAEAQDARELISSYNTPMEIVYANYANEMKALANKARVEYKNTKDRAYDAKAASVYNNEVESLKAKLLISTKNKPKERQAQYLANSRAQAKIDSDDEIKGSKGEQKKIRQQELTRARYEVGASRVPITIEPKEWEAIQSGAVNPTTLKQIIQYVDDAKLKELATPTNQVGLSSSQKLLISTLSSKGYTTSDIAERLGVSPSTISKFLINE